MNKSQTIVQEVNSILDQYQTKMTLRQIYYRLVAKIIIPNTLNEYKGLSRILVKAREKGEVDYRQIEDRSRSTLGRDYYDDDETNFKERAEDRLKDGWRGFQMSYWGNQPTRVEVWIEKDALSRLASEIADRFNVVTCPSKGYSSFSYVMDAVNRLNSYGNEELVILYLGDFDPSGLDITRDLQDRLYRYGSNARVERIALSAEQIEKYQLPPMPAKRSDSRFAKFRAATRGTDAVELDALEPPVLKSIIAAGIKEYIHEGLWAKRQDEIRTKRGKLQEEFENVEVMW